MNFSVDAQLHSCIDELRAAAIADDCSFVERVCLIEACDTCKALLLVNLCDNERLLMKAVIAVCTSSDRNTNKTVRSAKRYIRDALVIYLCMTAARGNSRADFLLDLYRMAGRHYKGNHYEEVWDSDLLSQICLARRSLLYVAADPDTDQ